MEGTAQRDMDPAGDLTSLVGPEDGQKAMIRVSSKALTLASPAFAALVGPKFAEGQALASNTITGAITSIPLPEDDPEAMKWFCRALHHKLNANEQEISCGLCHKLAIICDKYDTSVAMSGRVVCIWTSGGKLLRRVLSRECSTRHILLATIKPSGLSSRRFFNSVAQMT